MRKIILFNLITLDGFVAGPLGNIDWHRVDEEFNEFTIEQTSAAGGLIFGRVTYDMMSKYWPTPAALRDDPMVANIMNSKPKYVFSQTLDRAAWANTHLLRGEVVTEINRLKQQPGGDLMVFGSIQLSATLILEGLIDEFRLLLNPVILGKGVPLFQKIDRPLTLRLERTRSFRNGNVLLVYRPD